jgi:hypothetical protein
MPVVAIIVGFTIYKIKVEASSEGIVVEDADEVLMNTTEHTTDLGNVTREVTSRIITEYAEDLSESKFYKSEDLNQAATLVSPRITFEYVNFVSEVDLEKIASFNSSTTSSRIVVEYADSLISFDLIPPYAILPIPEQPISEPYNQTKEPAYQSENQTEAPTRVINLFSSQYTVQLPDGNTLIINYSTTSQIVRDLTQDSSNTRFSLQIDETWEVGFLIMFIPKEFIESYNSSIDNLIITLDEKEVTPTYVKEEGGGYLIRLEYGYGQHNINIYYLTFRLTVKIYSIFGLPVSGALVVLEWPEGKPFKALITSSSGIVTFKKVPSLNSAYTLSVKYGLLSFQFLPKEISINQNTETSFTAYLYYDTFGFLALSIIMSIVSWRIQKGRKKTAENARSET